MDVLTLWPKFDRTIVRSLTSTVPSPVNSPVRPTHAGGLAEVRQHDRQVVDVDLAVEVGVAGNRLRQGERIGQGISIVGSGADDFPRIVDAPCRGEDPAGWQHGGS